jgi:hypothetical protein
VRALLRDAVRLPRPLWWAPVAAFTVPGLTWAVASGLGGAKPLTTDLLADVFVAFLSSLLVINLWEEMAWTGFAQRRAMARWGLVRGSLVIAVLFAAIHLPLAFDGAETAGDVAVGIGILIGTGVGLRLLIAGLHSWSGRSLLAVAILHASSTHRRSSRPLHRLGPLRRHRPARPGGNSVMTRAPLVPDRQKILFRPTHQKGTACLTFSTASDSSPLDAPGGCWRSGSCSPWQR